MYPLLSAMKQSLQVMTGEVTCHQYMIMYMYVHYIEGDMWGDKIEIGTR